MSEFDIEVIGGRPPRKPDGPLKRLKRRIGGLLRAAMMRPRLLVLGGLAGCVLAFGTPHAGWDYECRHPMTAGQTCRSVSYCAYYGIQGRRVEFPEYGESCKLITVLPLDWQKIL